MKLWCGSARNSYEEDIIARAETAEQVIEWLRLEYPNHTYDVWEIIPNGQPGILRFRLPADVSTEAADREERERYLRECIEEQQRYKALYESLFPPTKPPDGGAG